MEEMNTVNVIENEEDVVIYDEPEKSGSGIVGKIIFGAVAVAAGIGAIVYKNRDKIEARRIRKLEKKGYVVYKKSDVDDTQVVDECQDSENE